MRNRNGSRCTAPRVAAFAAVLVLLAGPGYGADEALPETPTEQAPISAEPVSDAKLRQFAAVASEIQSVQQELAQDVQELQQVAEARMVALVQDGGLTVDEFTSIFQSVQANPELARRLDSLGAGGES